MDSFDVTFKLKQNQKIFSGGLAVSCVLIFIVLFNIRDLLLQQELVLEYIEGEMYMPHIEGSNGHGYFNAKADDFPENPNNSDYFKTSSYALTKNRQLHYLKYLLLLENIEYNVINKENGNYQNGDVAKLQMKLLEIKPYNLKIKGITTYETIIEDLADYKYKSYENINPEELEIINTGLNTYINSEYVIYRILGPSNHAQNITLIKKGFYNNFEDTSSKKYLDEFNPQSFIAKDLTSGNLASLLFHKENEIIYLYEVKASSTNSTFVTIRVPLNEENLSSLKNGTLSDDYFHYEKGTTQSNFLNSINNTYGEFMQWIEE